MTTLELIFAAPIAASGALAIAAELAGRRLGVYVFKPLTTALVIAMFAVEGAGAPRDWTWTCVVLGLVASLAGDVLLMLGPDRFAAGLASFLVAHAFYIAAFAGRALAVDGATGRVGYWAPLVALAIYGVGMLAYLGPGLGELRVPVAVYVAVITLMGWQAAAAYALAGDARAAEAFAGAALFVTSDSLLAVDKFRRRVPAAQAFVLSTYFAAQWLIASSAYT
jgi:uncharacterized membrane protein YhhN